MTTYLIHAEDGTHYVGYVKSKVGERLQQHQETMCTPPPPGSEDPRWIKHGQGAKYLGVLNYKQIAWAMVRTWVGETRKFERRLKDYKKSSRFCPACRGPRAYNCMKGTKQKGRKRG